MGSIRRTTFLRIVAIPAIVFSLACSGPGFSTKAPITEPRETFAPKAPTLPDLAHEEGLLSDLTAKNGPYTKQNAAVELTKYYIETNQWPKLSDLLSRKDANIKIGVLTVFADGNLVIKAAADSLVPALVTLLSSTNYMVKNLSVKSLNTLARNGFDISSAVSKLNGIFSENNQWSKDAARALYPHYQRLKDRPQIQKLNLFLYYSSDSVKSVNTDVASMAAKLKTTMAVCDIPLLGSSDTALYEDAFRLVADFVHDATYFGLDLSVAVPTLDKMAYGCDSFELITRATMALTEQHINQRDWEPIRKLLKRQGFFENNYKYTYRSDAVLATLAVEVDQGTVLPSDLTHAVIQAREDAKTDEMLGKALAVAGGIIGAYFRAMGLNGEVSF